MSQGPYLIVLLVSAIAFVVIATSRWKLHPFIVLIVAAYGVALLSGLPPLEVEVMVRQGFGGIVSYIGLIIVFGTLIGTLLEKSGAAITLAETVLRLFGKRFPGLALSLIGYIVSIPVFCDSGYIILSSLKRSIVKRTGRSAVMMSVALATGLFASHTLVPPTPGPIAAAGNLGLSEQLGLVIIMGLSLSIVPVLAGYAWAVWAGKHYQSQEDFEAHGDGPLPVEQSVEELDENTINRPSVNKAFSPIIVPIVLIALGSIAAYPTHPFGSDSVFILLSFFGKPLNALIVGFILALRLLPGWNEQTLNGWMGEGLKSAAIIILITGAGGAFGHVLKATPIGNYLGETLAQYQMGVLLPFIISAALKTAQGSSTVAMVTTSALIAPLLVTLGLDSEMGRVLAVMAVGAGAMTVSHANDSFFWVVAEFSGMDVKTAYRAFTLATLLQGLATISVIALLAFFLI